LNRPLSPIRHDYKPAAKSTVKKQNALPWFAAGLGLPLLGIALFLNIANSPADDGVEPDTAADMTESNAAAMEDTTSVAQLPVAQQAADDLIEIAEEDLIELPFPGFHPPLELPPEYDTLALTIRRGDTLDQLFRRNDLDLGDLAAIVRLEDAGPHLKKLIPGDELIIEHDEGNLVSLYRELDVTQAIKITREENGFATETVERPLEVRRKTAYGRIETSLFESAAQAGLPDKTVMNLAGIFAWDVDFVLDIRSGDDYYVLYEQLYQDGNYIGDGEIIAAEFNNNGRTIQAIRYVDKDGRSDYFTPEGDSVRKAFIRAPVDFTRVSSNFNPRRRHPILNTIRAHRGVDYAAPRGTPIKAAGDGKVIFRGGKNGYGNTVILQHGGNITTLYAHMSGFAASAKLGTRVRQGQTIGFVGATGLATANHLHYEYRVNGVHRNPRTVQLPQAEPIDAKYRDRFLATVDPILKGLEQFKRTQVASVDTGDEST